MGAQAILAPAVSFLVSQHRRHGSCNEGDEGRHEGKEGHEACDEGDEGNEEGEESEQNCEGAFRCTNLRAWLTKHSSHSDFLMTCSYQICAGACLSYWAQHLRMSVLISWS